MRYWTQDNCDLVYGSARAAGLDLKALRIDPVKGIIHTGVHVEIPEGLFGLLVPRSSTGMKKGLRLRNTVGIIDADYRGELMIAYDQDSLKCNAYDLEGERVAQLLIMPYHPCDLERVDQIDTLEDTVRGEGGFGSTGT